MLSPTWQRFVSEQDKIDSSKKGQLNYLIHGREGFAKIKDYYQGIWSSNEPAYFLNDADKVIMLTSENEIEILTLSAAL